jgi:imidazoleglycerol-phosphate dehydratase
MENSSSGSAILRRKTSETEVDLKLHLYGSGQHKIDTPIPFFNHMLELFSAHGFLDIQLDARGDVEIDAHHTVEDVGLVLGDALDSALGERQGIRRYGHAVTPMDEALAAVSIDLSKRPYLVFNVPSPPYSNNPFDTSLAKEFFRAFVHRGGFNLHINVAYGENEHHILEAVFKATGRALSQACARDSRVDGVRSTKGSF